MVMLIRNKSNPNLIFKRVVSDPRLDAVITPYGNVVSQCPIYWDRDDTEYAILGNGISEEELQFPQIKLQNWQPTMEGL